MKRSYKEPVIKIIDVNEMNGAVERIFKILEDVAAAFVKACQKIMAILFQHWENESWWFGMVE